MQYFKDSDGLQVLMKMVEDIQQNKGFLGDVDGLIGDGDHGMNMNKGFSEFGKRFGGQSISFAEGLNELGTILLTEIGGSMGPIYGTIFMAMGDSLDGKERITLADLSSALDSAREELFGIVDARVGDKTLVDCLSPACDTLKADLDSGSSFSKALEDMKAAAEKGRDSTKELQAKYGRSARLGARSIGVLDAGSCSCCIILQSMADGISGILEEG